MTLLFMQQLVNSKNMHHRPDFILANSSPQFKKDVSTCVLKSGGHRQSVRLSFTPEKLAGLNQILMKRRVFSPEDIQNIAAYFKLQESKCRMWFKEHGARLRRQSCSVRISPDLKKNSSDKRKSYVLKVRKRPSVLVNTAPRKKKNVPTCESLSEQNNANNSSATLEECSLNVDTEVESAVPKTDDSVVVSKLEEKCNADNDEDVKLSDEKLNTTLQQADEIKQEELESTNLEVNISGTDENKNAVSADTGPGMHPASLKIVNNTDRFFDDLSFQKKITLLKRTENLTNATSAYAQDLAAELDLPFRSVYTWLKSKCLRNSITWKKRLSRDKAAKLSDIFAASNILTEERALMLSYELDLSVCAIRKFFERKNTDTYSEPKSPSAGQSAQNDSEAEESPSGSHGSSATENEFVSKPVVLVRHCVPSGSMSNKCNNSSSTDASNAADNTRSSTGDEEYVLKKRRFVLSLRQRKILAQQFEKTPCISPSDAAALASKSNLPVKAIYLWFHRRRLEAKKLLVPKTNDGVENEKEKEKEN